MSDTAADRSSRVRWAIGWAVLGSLLTLWGAFRIATGTPGVGTWWILPLIVGVPLTLYQLGVVAYVRWKRALPRWPKRLLGLLFFVLVGWMGAGAIAGWASAKSLDVFAARNASLIERLELNRETICAEMSAYLDETAEDDATARASGVTPYTVVEELHHGERGFVVTFRGGSIDIDGSSIVYDGSSRAWDIVHKDDGEGVRRVVEEAVRGLTACELPH